METQVAMDIREAVAVAVSDVDSELRDNTSITFNTRSVPGDAEVEPSTFAIVSPFSFPSPRQSEPDLLVYKSSS